MKTNIEVTTNHPAHQQVIEFMTELLPKVEMAKTEFDALQVVRENCLDTPFFWGAGLFFCHMFARPSVVRKKLYFHHAAPYTLM